MKCVVALLRAVNVGGTGKLPMADLRAICQRVGFADPQTYIASGNVVFDADGPTTTIKAKLESALEAYAGKHIGVILRTAEDMNQILTDNPFAHLPGERTIVQFMEMKANPEMLTETKYKTDELMELGKYEIYVHYPSGQGQSKLMIAAAKHGTGRNMNTVNALAKMANNRA
jgi:uncharacterized protein (DUF1697 family)